jgi:hypothetical protein
MISLAINYSFISILYKVVDYIVLHRVTKHGIEELDVLNGLPKIEKVYKFLKYFLNEKSLLTWIKDAWSSHFEYDHVEYNLNLNLEHF